MIFASSKECREKNRMKPKIRIGFIGAGKVGTCLGRLFNAYTFNVIGYYSHSFSSAHYAASLTKSTAFLEVEELLSCCDWIFLTVPDIEIAKVWNEIKDMLSNSKLCIFHCSGAEKSTLIEISSINQRTFSLHPLFAFSDKQVPLTILEKIHFTLEGKNGCVEIEERIKNLPNMVSILTTENKSLYHAACVFCSNLIVGLTHISESLFSEIGLDNDTFQTALSVLFLENAKNIATKGTKKSLTGPVARNDIHVVEQHLKELSGEYRQIYRFLSKEILTVAK